MTPEERAQMICQWLDEGAGIVAINGFHGLIVEHFAAARSEALEEAAKIADHHAEVHDTAVKCYDAYMHRGGYDIRLAWGHKEASLCAAKIAADIRALKGGK